MLDSQSPQLQVQEQVIPRPTMYRTSWFDGFNFFEKLYRGRHLRGDELNKTNLRRPEIDVFSDFLPFDRAIMITVENHLIVTHIVFSLFRTTVSGEHYFDNH